MNLLEGLLKIISDLDRENRWLRSALKNKTYEPNRSFDSFNVSEEIYMCSNCNGSQNEDHKRDCYFFKKDGTPKPPPREFK